ncbi:MFS general substrate transporter [Hortaea werneckii]|nr:MFS general substrate transporter [Hortaea werneckii]
MAYSHGTHNEDTLQRENVSDSSDQSLSQGKEEGAVYRENVVESNDTDLAPAHNDFQKEVLETADPHFTVSKEREQKLIRKLDIRILPMIMWMYLMSFMDRVIIGAARLYGVEEDLNLGPNQFQLAVSILFVTYCIFETPSNLIIKRLNPAYYLCGLTFCWGIIATFTAFVQGIGGLLACRLLLGIFEAGFFPGVIIYLTIFYNKRELALRTGYFFSAAAISSAVGGLVAYGIGEGMDGTAGWRAWRWILLINGAATAVTAPFVPFILPGSVEKARFLTEQDRKDLLWLRTSEVGQTASGQDLQKKDVMDGVKDWKTYAYGLAQFCSHLMLYSFSVFLPTVISRLGEFDRGESNALTVPVFALGAIVYIISCWASDRLQVRGPFTMGAFVVSIVGYAMLISNGDVAVKFAGTFIVACGCYTSVGLGFAWLASNNPRYGKRAYASGMQITIGNSAGVAAPFLFADSTEPRFIPGYSASIATLAVGMCIHAALSFWFHKQNKNRAAGKEDWKMEGKTPEEVADMGDLNPLYRYTI